MLDGLLICSICGKKFKEKDTVRFSEVICYDCLEELCYIDYLADLQDEECKAK